MVRVRSSGQVRRNNNLAQRLKRVRVALCYIAAPGNESVELYELVEAYGGLDLRHPDFVTRFADLVAPRARPARTTGRILNSMHGEATQSHSEFRVARSHHSAVAGAHVLRRIETESRDACATDLCMAIGCA